MKRKIFLFIFLLLLFSENAFCNNPPPPGPMQRNPPCRPFENFRGRRKPKRMGTCQLIRIKIIPFSKDGIEYANVELFFNQSIDPRSVRHENIVVNSVALNHWHKILFNKSATCVSFVLKNEASFSLSVDGILSYNASPVPKAQILAAESGSKYFFDRKDSSWKKY